MQEFLERPRTEKNKGQGKDLTRRKGANFRLLAQGLIDTTEGWEVRHGTKIENRENRSQASENKKNSQTKGLKVVNGGD